MFDVKRINQQMVRSGGYVGLGKKTRQNGVNKQVTMVRIYFEES